jgi:acyl-CoA dehydrogenase
MSDARQMFEDTASRLWAEFASQAVIEAAENGVFSAALWDNFGSLGFADLLVSAEAGGTGADWEDAAAVMRSAGYYAAPGPIAETILANFLLSGTGRPTAVTAGLLIGNSDRGAWLRACDTLIRVAGDRIEVLEKTDAIMPMAGFTGEPVDRLTAAMPLACFELPAAELIARGGMAILRSAQMAGAMEWCIERSVEYAQERSQFGKPLAKLQIVQQYLAEAAGELVAADALMNAASKAGPLAVMLVAAARVRCADAAEVVFAKCHQVHGAIGFSREYALNYRSRRLMGWRDEAGATSFWREKIGDLVMASDAGIWTTITDGLQG